MPIRITARQVDGGVTILDCVGRITLGEGAQSLRDTLTDLAKCGEKKVILNLADTHYVDGSGIGEMVSGFVRLVNSGGELELLTVGKRVKDLLQISKLYTVFDVHDDEKSAICSFR